MLKIENIDELCGEGFITNGKFPQNRKFWTISRIEEAYVGAYDIRVERKISTMESEILTIRILRELSNKIVAKGYEVEIIKEGYVIDRDHIRLDKMKTMHDMLNQLTTIIELMQ